MEILRLVLPAAVYVADEGTGGGGGRGALPPTIINIEPPEGMKGVMGYSIPGIVSALVQLGLVAGAIVAFFFLIIGGIKWITAGGDKEQTTKAQGTITAAIIGLVVVFAAWAIIRLIESFFKISIISNLQIPQVSY